MNDKLNYNLHPCNFTNQYICYFNNFIFAVYCNYIVLAFNLLIERKWIISKTCTVYSFNVLMYFILITHKLNTLECYVS